MYLNFRPPKEKHQSKSTWSRKGALPKPYTIERNRNKQYVLTWLQKHVTAVYMWYPRRERVVLRRTQCYDYLEAKDRMTHRRPSPTVASSTSQWQVVTAKQKGMRYDSGETAWSKSNTRESINSERMKERDAIGKKGIQKGNVQPWKAYGRLHRPAGRLLLETGRQCSYNPTQMTSCLWPKAFLLL